MFLPILSIYLSIYLSKTTRTRHDIFYFINKKWFLTSQVLSALRYLIQFNGLNEAKWSGLRFQNDLSLSWVSPIKRFLETLLFMYL